MMMLMECLTAREWDVKRAAEDLESARHDLRVTAGIAAKMRLEAAVLHNKGWSDNGRLRDADLLMDRAEAWVRLREATYQTVTSSEAA